MWTRTPEVSLDAVLKQRDFTEFRLFQKPETRSRKKCRSPKTWKKYLQKLLNKGYYLVKYQKK